MLQRLFGRSGKDAAERLYAAVVAQARQPVFYTELEAPDTVDGRFDMIVLHTVLVMRRLRADGAAGQDFAQGLFDALFRDMDRSLREMGVGDLVVPKRIRRMAEAFYGRAGRYGAALDARDEDDLARGLAANIRGVDPDDAAHRLAAYVLAAEAELASQEAAAIRRADLRWPAI